MTERSVNQKKSEILRVKDNVTGYWQTTLQTKRNIGRLPADAPVYTLYDSSINLAGRRALIFAINMYPISRYVKAKTGIDVNGHTFLFLLALDQCRAVTALNLRGVAAGITRRRVMGVVYDHLYLLVHLGLVVRSRFKGVNDTRVKIYYHLSALGRVYCEAINKEVDFIEASQPVFNYEFK